jgi:hypothetical protein
MGPPVITEPLRLPCRQSGWLASAYVWHGCHNLAGGQLRGILQALGH